MKCWPPIKPKTFPLLNPAPKSSPGVSWGQFVQPVSSPRFTCIICPNLFPIGPAIWPHFPGFCIVDPLKPSKMPPWCIVGRIVFSLCPFPEESTNVYRIWCQLVYPFGSSPRLKFVTPQNVPWDIVWRFAFSLYPFESADVNQSWCQSVQPFDSFSRLLSLWPPKTPKCPTCVLKGNFWRISIPRWICTCVPNLVPIGPAVWQLQHTFECLTPKPLPKCPLVYRGAICW